jgi:PRC-barrel domain
MARQDAGSPLDYTGYTKRAVDDAQEMAGKETAVTDAGGQVAGETKRGVTVAELTDVIRGWSARRQLLGQHVYNDKNEKIGEVEDIIISPERSASYAIVSTGGFLGIGSRDVAIPATQLKESNGRLTLVGATKETLCAMPPFEYARR